MRNETKTTMHLLHQALAQDPNASTWARHLGLSRAALSIARARGRLSPTVAGNLARLLGEDVDKWVVIAALEAEPASYGLDKVRSMVRALNSWIKHRRRDGKYRARHRTA